MSEPVRAAPVITFRREQATAELCEEIESLVKIHHEIFEPDEPFDPDYPLYLKMEEMGALRVYIARSNGELIGYFIFVIGPNLHAKGQKIASQEAIFIHPAHRGCGEEMLSTCETALFLDGCSSIAQRAKENTPMEKILSRNGYRKKETIFVKYEGD